MNEKEEDEKGFEHWINNSNHPRIYATTAVAEQNALSTFNSNTMFIPKDVIPQVWPNVYTQVKYIIRTSEIPYNAYCMQKICTMIMICCALRLLLRIF